MNVQIHTPIVFNADGSILFPELEISITPAVLTPEKCRSILADYKKREESQGGPDYTRQHYRVLFEGMPASLSFCFYCDQLFSLELGVSLPGEKLINGWPTRESCEKEIAFIQKAFKKQFGNKPAYGKPFHFYDERSACSCCGISYKEYIKKNYFKHKMTIQEGEYVHYMIVMADGRRFFEEHGTLKNNVLVGLDAQKHLLETCETEEAAMQKAQETVKKYRNRGYS